MKHDIRQSKVSDSVKRLNPHLFAVGQFQPQIAQQKAERALDSQSPGRQGRKPRVARSCPVARVTLTRFGRKEFDRDNLLGGFKPLRDSIARWIGYDDADNKYIEWEYSQVLTKGTTGTAVRIEFL